MTLPTASIWIDFDVDGAFSGGDDVTAYVESAEWSGGRNADFSGDAQGSATFVLKNSAGTFNSNLRLGLPVHIRSNYSATDRAHFYGFIQTVSPNAWDRTVTVSCLDPLKRMSDTDVAVTTLSEAITARDYRIAILEDFERGNLNFLPNPSFETNTTNWGVANSSITRLTSDNAPGAGSACGQWVWSSGTATLKGIAYLTPVARKAYYAASVYLKSVSGATELILEIIDGATSTALESTAITITTSWARYNVVGQLQSNRTAVAGSVYLQLRIAEAATIKVDAAAITRGQALYPYADVGTGRWPNYVVNGGFDGQSLNGWYDGFVNLIPNPSFEVNTTGWAVTSDGFHNAATSITRSTTSPKYGVGRGDVASSVALKQGAHNAITGTFRSGVTYDWSVWVMSRTGSTVGWHAGIGSNGTVGDVSDTDAGSLALNVWTQITGTWTPSSDRTDAHFYVYGPSSFDFSIDGAMVTRRDAYLLAAAPTSYSDTGPGGGGSFLNAAPTIVTSPAKYGSSSHGAPTPATATAGRIYDFNHAGVIFLSGQAYTASVWLYAADAMPYKVGIGANKGDGTWDEASTTGTLTANQWNQVTVTWTPSANRTSSTPFDVLLYIYQTDGTARTFYIDGVRVIPGSSADDFEMSHWIVPAGADPDNFLLGAELAGSALGALAQLNSLSDSRHWIEAELTSPFYSYHVEDRDTYDARTSVETFSDDFGGFDDADLSLDSVHNVLQITYNGSHAAYYSDETSVDTYGPTAAVAIEGGAFFPNRIIPDKLGPAFVARYGIPRRRPTQELVVGGGVTTYATSMLERELNDVVTVTLTRLGISAKEYSVIAMKTTVTNGMKVWRQSRQLEEFG